ncbi:uncharacterized protein LOC143058504 [Mytilus galloprovincialis]|uniref:uncharacterized protein LOC143058504 n=1 Tax=Mytilus galloprovincialis TaxID=29158 RepID=UPI003F7BF4C8
MAFGVSSYVCRLPYVNAGSFQTACTGLWCVNPNLANQCSLILPAERTSCGKGKWCEGYQCVTSSNAPALTENCVFGDQTGVIVLGQTCASLILQQSYRCYNPTIYPQCCKSCNNLATSVTGCEFGDKSDCSAITSYGCYANGENCCNTCSPYITNIPDCKYGDRSDCSGIKGGDQCYGDNGNTCCQTCTQFKSTIADCEYGDKANNCDVNLCTTYSKNDTNLCCYTCNGITPASSPPTPNNPETTTASTTALPVWVLPVAISAGCLLLLILIIVIVCCLRMSRRSHREPPKAPLKNVVSHDKIRYQNNNALRGGPKHQPPLRKQSSNGEIRPPPVKRKVSNDAIKTQSSTRSISKDTFPSQQNRGFSRPPTGRQGYKSNYLSPQRSKRGDQYYSNSGYNRY